jgi:molybdate transport system substrate-binding protein
VVFAAASLKDALDAVNADWQKESGKQAVISTRRPQGSPSRSSKARPPAFSSRRMRIGWTYLATRKLIKPDTRFDLLGNQLVLIAPKDSNLTATIAAGFPIASLIGNGRLAMADTQSVPAGKYGKASLEKLGVWA